MKLKTALLKLFLIAFFFFTYTAKVRAQANTIEDAFVILDDNGQTIACSFIVQLSDTNNIQQIEVKLGTSASSSNIANQTFDYDVFTGLPSGFSYQRDGNKLTLGIGSFTERNTYFGSVRVKVSGTWSDPHNFVSN